MQINIFNDNQNPEWLLLPAFLVKMCNMNSWLIQDWSCHMGCFYACIGWCTPNIFTAVFSPLTASSIAELTIHAKDVLIQVLARLLLSNARLGNSVCFIATLHKNFHFKPSTSQQMRCTSENPAVSVTKCEWYVQHEHENSLILRKLSITQND